MHIMPGGAIWLKHVPNCKILSIHTFYGNRMRDAHKIIWNFKNKTTAKMNQIYACAWTTAFPPPCLAHGNCIRRRDLCLHIVRTDLGICALAHASDFAIALAMVISAFFAICLNREILKTKRCRIERCSSQQQQCTEHIEIHFRCIRLKWERSSIPEEYSFNWF